MSELTAERQRQIVEDIWDAYRSGEDAARAMEYISRLHGVEQEVIVDLLLSEELRPTGVPLPEEGGEPQRVFLVGHETSDGFCCFAVEDGENPRELPVFSSLEKAGRILEDLGHNPEVVRSEVPMEDAGALEVPFSEAMHMAVAQGFDYVSLDLCFSDTHQLIPVSEAS